MLASLHSTSSLWTLTLIWLYFRLSQGYVTTCKPVVSLDKDPEVKVAGFGTFRGSATSSLNNNRVIYQYLGIPYAIPPLGPWRFKAPVSLTSLNQHNIYDAKYFKPPCPQLITEEDDLYLQTNKDNAEDCLYLNVFTTKNSTLNEDSVWPVMIYIHGGGYYQNSAMDHCPNYLLDHDMILVTVQYRLGPLGFLNLDTDDVAGNMGLLDTLEAIEWVSKYIKYFGGDNQRITLAGQSSGAVSVSLMMVSPLVRPGLFQQAIIQSGNFLGDWAIDRHSKEHAVQFAKYVNCSQIEVSEMITCLRNVSSYDIIQANNQYMIDRITSTGNAIKEIGISHAVIQKAGTKRFLNQQPLENLEAGNFFKVPVMTGVTKDEGSMVLEGFISSVLNPTYQRLYLNEQNQSIYLKNEFFYDFLKFLGITEDIHRIELIKDFYLPEEMCNDFNHTIPGLVDLSGALSLKSLVLQFARHMAHHTPTYLYSFNFKGRKTKLGYGVTPKHIYFNGVAHSDDLLYLFPYPKDSSLNKYERKVVQYITGLWSSFVISGSEAVSSPDLPEWPPMSTVVGPYLQIGDTLQVKDSFLNEYRNYVYKYVKGRNNSTSDRSIETWLPLLLLLAFFVS